MKEVTLTLKVPDDQDPKKIIEDMVEEFWYANRHSLGDGFMEQWEFTYDDGLSE